MISIKRATTEEAAEDLIMKFEPSSSFSIMVDGEEVGAIHVTNSPNLDSKERENISRIENFLGGIQFHDPLKRLGKDS